MPFILYKFKSNKNGTRTFIKVRNISLGGKYGPIASYVHDEYIRRNKETYLNWHMSQKELLNKLKVSPNDHAILIDLKPKTKGNISLYQIMDIWGGLFIGMDSNCIKT